MVKKNYMVITPSEKDGDNKAKIKFNDELTIYTIETISESVIKGIKNYKEIEIDLSEVKSIDLTFIQLIDSIRKSGKKVYINAKLSPENLTLFGNTDLLKILRK